MGISLKTHKILWGRAGGKCSICKNPLIIDPTDSDDDPSIIGDEAHIVARKESFTRGNYDTFSTEERDQYSNLILLCKVHHKLIDDQPLHYTVERLREIKATHEAFIKASWTDADEHKQRDEEIYASYIDEWAKRSNLNDWEYICTLIDSTGMPSLPKEWYESAHAFLPWVISRIWPGRYPLLEKSFLNYKAVLQDFLEVFNRHVDFDRDDEKFVRTQKFYKIKEYNPERYNALAKKYDEHTSLLSDLFFELTRAANFVCDRVREYIFYGFRLKEGALLILRNFVGWEMRTVHARVEYKGNERTELPYPGLEEFKKIRYTRDYALDPNPPEPPTSKHKK